MTKKRLLPIQIEKLNKELEHTIDVFSELKEGKQQIMIGELASNRHGHQESGDYSLIGDLSQLSLKIKTMNDLLKDSMIETNYSENTIDVGTIFMATINMPNGEIDEAKYLLVSSDVINLDLDLEIASLDSPFGNAVFKKRIGEKFSYMAPNNRKISGEITNIYSKEEATLEIDSTSQDMQKSLTR